MTPQSKEEAVRLAISNEALQEADRLCEAYGEVNYRRTLARYIEANPAISAKDRKDAERLAYQYSILEGRHNQEVARLLRLIAGPEEVDPLYQAVVNTWPDCDDQAYREDTDRLRTALHNAGYDIVKRESV